MSAQHTPGPWQVIEEAHPRANRGLAPMSLVRTSAGHAAIDCTRSGLTFASDNANARLIAAAPDLLAALESVADYWAGGDVPPDIDAAMRAAIAKARGHA